MDVIRRWLDLSELERRAFNALAKELTASSVLVETSTLDLSDRFQELATIAQAQMGRVESIITVAKSVEVDGEAVPMASAMQFVEHVLLKVIETILSVSKHAMRMVYVLDDVTNDVGEAEKCAIQIEVINRQTRYLALNAAIEATRAGGSQSAFGVIAHEMKELSLATEAISKEARERIATVATGVRNGRLVLQDIATLDMSEHILAKRRLDALVAGIMTQNQSFTAVLTDAVEASSEMARTIGQLITGMQFQDRAKQHTAHVVDALGVLGEAVVSAQQATWSTYPGMFQPGAIDQEWLGRILENNALAAVKQRMLTHLVNDSDADSTTASSNEQVAAEEVATDQSSGDVELF